MQLMHRWGNQVLTFPQVWSHQVTFLHTNKVKVALVKRQMIQKAQLIVANRLRLFVRGRCTARYARQG